MVLEWLKHKAEHGTHGTHRGEALNAIFSELMMIGIISFVLILAGEFGLSGVKIATPCQDGMLASPNQTDTVATVRRTAASLSASASVWEHLAQPRHKYAEVTLAPRVPGGAEYVIRTSWDEPANHSGPWPADENSAVQPGHASYYTGNPDEEGAHRRGAHTLGQGSDSGSGSGEEKECYIGVTILLLEYAHLVLFVMGITYGSFIQVAFMRRNQYVEEIATIQKKKTLGGCNQPLGLWEEPSLWCVSGLGTSAGWQRTVLCMRNAVVLHQQDRLKDVCRPEEYEVELALSELKHSSRPSKRAVPDEAESAFDFARFVHKAQAETLVELVHVPPVVWLGIVGMSGVNLVYYWGISLPRTLLCFSFLMPLMAVGLVLRMGAQLRSVVRGAVGHPNIDTVNWDQQPPQPGDPYFAVLGPEGRVGRQWADGEGTPWETLTGCCEDGSALDFLDLNDPGALKVQIQMIVFSSCFFLGQLCMLALMVIDELGPGGFIGILLISLFPLVVILPRAILLYTLTHRTFEPPRTWLEAAVSTGEVEDHKKKDPVFRLREFLNRNRPRAGSSSATTAVAPAPTASASGGFQSSSLTSCARPPNAQQMKVSFVQSPGQTAATSPTSLGPEWPRSASEGGAPASPAAPHTQLTGGVPAHARPSPQGLQRARGVSSTLEDTVSGMSGMGQTNHSFDITQQRGPGPWARGTPLVQHRTASGDISSPQYYPNARANASSQALPAAMRQPSGAQPSPPAPRRASHPGPRAARCGSSQDVEMAPMA